MRLRIVAGEFGGRRILAPPGRSTRPTRASVREAWFNVLGYRVHGARVVDLFAGSGALGLEALSRGAAHVDFIERRPRTLTVLKRNVETLGVGGRAGIFGEDAFAFLARAGRHVCYDIALADPPYDSDAIERLIELNRRAPFAHLLCVECPNDTIRDGEPALAWQRRYGDTTLAFFTTMNGGGYQGDK